VTIFTRISANRTKLIGYAGAAFGAGQATWEVAHGQPFWRAVVTMGLGIGTALIGHYNTSIINRQITQGAADSLAAANVPLAVAHTAMRAAGVTPPPVPVP
jgi:hypothetical protein